MSNIDNFISARLKRLDNFVYLNDIADELRLDYTNFRKFVAKYDIRVSKIANPKRNNQKCLAVTHEDAKRVIKLKLG